MQWRLDPIAVVIMVVGFALLIGVGVAMAGPPPESNEYQATAVDACTRIDEPGAYVLVTDIIDDRTTRLSQACIVITADDVVFDGDGHRVDGKGISDTTGVRVRNASDVVVRDLRVTNWNRGVHYNDVTGGGIVAVNASWNARGLDLDRSSDITVEAGMYTANLIGVDLNRQNADIAVDDDVARDNHVVDVYREADNATAGEPATTEGDEPASPTDRCR